MAKQTLPTGWKSVRFEYLFDRLTQRNTAGNTNVLTISARYGLINQEEFFNKSVASEDLSTYYLLERGDFAYNKSYSAEYKYGAFKQLTRYDSGVVSPLYICFSANQHNQCTDFYVQYFESMLLDREIKAFAQEGARNHGLLNIAIGDFFSMSLPLPPLAEQRSIAEILTIADRLISVKERLIAAKRQQKRWLMSQLFTGKLRLPGFSGAWKSVRLGNYLIEHKEITTSNNQYPVLTSSRRGIFLQTDYYNKDIASEDNTGYNVVPFGYFTYRHMSDDEIFRFNINSLVPKGIVSTLYPVFTTKNIDEKFLLEILNEGTEFRRYSRLQKQGGSRTYMYFSKLSQLRLTIPSLPEQQAIAAVLTAADREIELLTRELEQQRQSKKYLMQQLLTGRIRTKGATI